MSKREKFSFRVMSDLEYQIALKEKLIEEAIEVKESLNNAELKEELADILEVSYALIDAYNLNIQEIEEFCLKKKNEKGGFKNKFLLTKEL